MAQSSSIAFRLNKDDPLRSHISPRNARLDDNLKPTRFFVCTATEAVTYVSDLSIKDKRDIIEFRIYGTGEVRQQVFGYDFWKLRLPNIQTLELSDVVVQRDTLLNFIRKHSRSLLHVAINEVTFAQLSPQREAACGEWTSIIEALRFCKKLKSLDIFKMGWQHFPGSTPTITKQFLHLPKAKYALKSADETDHRQSCYRLSQYGVEARTVVQDARVALVRELQATIPENWRAPRRECRPYARVPYRQPR